MSEEANNPQVDDSNTKPVESEGQSISGMVNAELVGTLMSMGYSKNVSEKSLFLNNNNFDTAMEWIYCNQTEKDFEEELRIVQAGQEKPKMTDEEAYQKAKELQEKARKIIKEKETEAERVNALKRIEEKKKILETIELHEEVKNKQYIEDMEKKRQKEREEFLAKLPKKDYKPIDDIEYNLQLFLTFNPRSKGDTSYDCFNMIRTICNNIHSNPNEDKFKKIKYTSAGFQNKVGQHEGPMKIFDILGFVKEGEFLIYKGTDKNLLEKSIDLLDNYIQKA